MKLYRASGDYLTQLAANYDLPRWRVWFLREPDFLLRYRLIRAIAQTQRFIAKAQRDYLNPTRPPD